MRVKQSGNGAIGRMSLLVGQPHGRSAGRAGGAANAGERQPRSSTGIRRWLRNNGLALTMAGLLLVSLVGHSIAGAREYNSVQAEHGEATVGYVTYLTTGHFVESVFENWESEFLQMAAYVFLTAFLIQKGSAESKKPPEEERQSGGAPAAPEQQIPAAARRGGVVQKLYENSLGLALTALFVASFLLHAAGGAREFSLEQTAHGGQAVSMLRYMATSRFWFESLQNWQSEFLAVLSLVVLSIWLRQKGSPESKPVEAPHGQTGS